MKHKSNHRYIRKKTEKGTVLFRCNLPGCRHYLLETFIEGQISICHGCGNDFEILGNEKYKRLPLCANCRGKKRKITPVPVDSVSTLLDLIAGKK